MPLAVIGSVEFAEHTAVRGLRTTYSESLNGRQDRICGYYERLRQFFYGYLFTDKPFVKSDYDRIPPFEPAE